MSVSFLKIIPTNPEFVPTINSQEQGKLFLKTIFQDNEIEIITTEEINFVDQGENFEIINCNICDQIMDNKFWVAKMDKSYENFFKDLTFITECCGKLTSLNNLAYEYPNGFSKFIIEIRNPSINLSPSDIIDLEILLQTPLRLIWAHY